VAPCQPGEEEADADEVDETLGRARETFIVLAQAAVPAQPRKRVPVPCVCGEVCLVCLKKNIKSNEDVA
jgi:hypothetical protein